MWSLGLAPRSPVPLFARMISVYRAAARGRLGSGWLREPARLDAVKAVCCWWPQGADSAWRGAAAWRRPGGSHLCRPASHRVATLNASRSRGAALANYAAVLACVGSN